MAVSYLKKAVRARQADHQDVRGVVGAMLDEIRASGEEAVRRYSRELDKWEGDIVVPRAAIDAAVARIPEKLKDDIRFAHGNIRRFAEAQRATIIDCNVEVLPGLTAGQRQIPVSAAGRAIGWNESGSFLKTRRTVSGP